MADHVVLQVYLMFARALAVSTPFDAMGTFELLLAISKEAKMPMEGTMEAAADASMDALSTGQPRSSAVARFALRRVIIEIEGHLGYEAT